MGQYHDKHYPGETADYRTARDALLAAEQDLRRQVEVVAAQRRALPLGGPVREDYVFEEGAADPADRGTVRQTRLSELFAAGKDSLALYSFMFGPDAETPCPMCTAFLDSLNGNAAHVGQRMNLAIVAKAPIEKIRDWAAARSWNNLRFLSSGGNSYNADYFAETPDGSQIPPLNVFRRTPDGIYHAYATELLYAPAEEGQHMRHMDMMWPLWNLFDLTPAGRGADWFPQYAYD